MYKLLIADDEPKIRRGLRQSIEKSGLDVCICAEAEDGEQALQYALAQSPDLMIVDICMPFLSGLEFLQRLGTAIQTMIVIILSGHDEFSYAQQALQLGVYAYMLKPVDCNELCRTIQNGIDTLKNKRNADKHLQWAVSQLNKRKHYHQERFFIEWSTGNLTNDEIDQYFEYFEICLPQSPALMLLCPCVNKDREDLWSDALVQFAITNVLNDLLIDHAPFYVFTDERENIVALLHCARTDFCAFAAAIQNTILMTLQQHTLVLLTAIDNPYTIQNEYHALLEQFALEQSCSPAVVAAQKIIEHKYKLEDLGLSEVAQEIGINASYLSRLMKQELGVSYIEYLTQVRIRKALEWMDEGDVKIKIIAQKCGYSSQNYFSNAFKKVLGVSPQDYKKRKARQMGGQNLHE